MKTRFSVHYHSPPFPYTPTPQCLFPFLALGYFMSDLEAVKSKVDLLYLINDVSGVFKLDLNAVESKVGLFNKQIKTSYFLSPTQCF